MKIEMRVTSRDGDQVAEVSYRLVEGLTRTVLSSGVCSEPRAFNRHSRIVKPRAASAENQGMPIFKKKRDFVNFSLKKKTPYQRDGLLIF